MPARGQYGPMILDGEGRLLWFKRLPAGARAANLRVQEYDGRPVLSWWQDPLVAAGHRGSGVVIADSSYHRNRRRSAPATATSRTCMRSK